MTRVLTKTSAVLDRRDDASTATHVRFSYAADLAAGEAPTPDHGEPEREVDMNGTIVEHADTEPDHRAELDQRVRPEAFGFRA